MGKRKNECPVPISPSLNVAPSKDAEPQWVDAVVMQRNDGTWEIYYNGVNIADGPGHGVVVLVNGQVDSWLLPTTREHWEAVEQKKFPKWRTAGHWPEGLRDIVNY